MSLDTLPTPKPVTLGRVGIPPLKLSTVLEDNALLVLPPRPLLDPPLDDPPPPLALKDFEDDALGPEDPPLPPDPVVRHSSSTGEDLSPAPTAALYSPLSPGVNSRVRGLEAAVAVGGSAKAVEVVELGLRPLASSHSSGAGMEQASQSSPAFFMVHTEQVHSSSKGTAEGLGELGREVLACCSPDPFRTPVNSCSDALGAPADGVMPRALRMALAGSSEEEAAGVKREGGEMSSGLVVCSTGCFKLAADGTTSS
jgi:hypothetical protein